MSDQEHPGIPGKIPSLKEDPEALAVHFASKTVLRELILQLKKDFHTAGVPIKLLLSERYSFDALRNFINGCLQDYSGKQISLLLNRVDISERQFTKGMTGPGLDTVALSELIIKRELQKVVLRQLFSNAS